MFQMYYKPGQLRRNLTCALILACLIFLPLRITSAKEDPASAAFKAMNIELIGVLQSHARAKALVRMNGQQNEILIGQGDLLSGYTLKEVQTDQLTFIRGTSKINLQMQNSQLLKPSLKMKTYTANYSGSNHFHPTSKSSRWKSASASTPRKVRSASKSARPSFIRPMQGWVSSKYGPRRRPRSSGGYGSFNHQGIDIAAPHGSPVYAAADGVVKARGYDGSGKGRYIIIRHSGGYETSYFHLSRQYVSKGDTIRAGKRIGREGNTGNSTGAHLHFEIRKNRVPIDPSLFISSLRKR